jgi:HPt (histidine-containing phosphotransfer) domain-containing protein
MTAPTIDPATFEALKAMTGAPFALDLVDTFLEEAPVMLETLRKAFEAKDADTFRRAAHSLKSNSNTFGALALGAMARELELAGVAQVGTPSLDALAQEYARVAAALSALRHA